MAHKINIPKNITGFVAVVLTLFLANNKVAAQCAAWYISAVPGVTTCASNASINITLIGDTAGAVTNRLFSLLKPDSSIIREATSTPGFSGLTAGSYIVRVQAVCGGVSVTKDTLVTISGTYVRTSVVLTQKRRAWYHCSTGQAYFDIRNGRAPFTISMNSYPAAYTGGRSFTANGSYTVENLAPGDYSFVIYDSCGSSDTKSVTIQEAPQISTGNVSFTPAAVGAGCNQFRLGYIVLGGSEFTGYSGQGSPVSVAYALNGGTPVAYKPVYEMPDTVTLPAGQSIKNVYEGTVTIYIKGPCGQILSFDTTLARPAFVKQASPDLCRNTFDLGYYVQSSKELVCYPVHVKVTDMNTNKSYSNTISGVIYQTSFTYGLPFSDYKIEATAADGYRFPIQDAAFSVSKPDTIGNVFTASVSSSGPNGLSGFGYINLKKNAKLLSNTKVELISPATMSYSAVIYVSPGAPSQNVILPASKSSGYQLFPAGTYLFRVTDSCGTYLVQARVDAEELYYYSWAAKTRATCRGYEVIPKGYGLWGTDTLGIVYYMVTSPARTDTRSYRNGDTIVFTNPGTYKVSIGFYAGTVYDYGMNTIAFNYENTPVSFDMNKTNGWVCPSASDNDGVIQAQGQYGRMLVSNNTGSVKYTYRLAASGNGNTGPYLASNNTGRFSTALSGGAYTLIANQSYDVRVEDECGSAAVQPVKIVDYSTAQVVSAEKAEYCLGEQVRFSVINLPATAGTYHWTGPGNFESSSRNPVLTMTEAGKGLYRVAISSDMCQDSIIGTVNIGLVPFITTCYSAITDTSVNPYIYGLLGNWRQVRTQVYYGARKESDPDQPTNIRTDGAFEDFNAFWKIVSGKWATNQEDKKWVWNSESTIFNVKGFELENRDPLGRYNAGIYGYDNAIPVAVVENSRYQESAFDGFEDYDFGSNACDTPCATSRSFDFSIYRSKMDSTEKHSGRYSLRVIPGDTVGINAEVMNAVPAFSDITFESDNNACLPYEPSLGKIKAGKSVILPSFAPVSGKKFVFSAWVKEAQDCKCSTYVSNQVILSVMNASGNSTPVNVQPEGAIIDGWQRYEQVIEIPAGSQSLSIALLTTANVPVYFDDIRIHPYNANMKSFVYDPKTLRMMAELDENNYATFFEYDDDGTLTRVKKETERGVKTIKETRSALIKE